MPCFDTKIVNRSLNLLFSRRKCCTHSIFACLLVRIAFVLCIPSINRSTNTFNCKRNNKIQMIHKNKSANRFLRQMCDKNKQRVANKTLLHDEVEKFDYYLRHNKTIAPWQTRQVAAAVKQNNLVQIITSQTIWVNIFGESHDRKTITYRISNVFTMLSRRAPFLTVCCVRCTLHEFTTFWICAFVIEISKNFNDYSWPN